MVLPNGQLQFITGLEFIRNVQTSGLHTIRSEISFRSEKNILQKNPQTLNNGVIKEQIPIYLYIQEYDS